MPAILVAIVAIAYGAAYGTTVGLAIGVPAAIVATALLWPLSPIVSVSDDGLRAGRAALPAQFVGEVRVLDRAGLLEQRRRGDARTYLVLRPWRAHTAVWVGVSDPQDPHPAWLITSAAPQTLVDALNRVAGRGGDTAESSPTSPSTTSPSATSPSATSTASATSVPSSTREDADPPGEIRD